MKKIIVAVSVLSTSFAFAGTHTDKPKKGGKTQVQVPAGDLKWEQPYGPQGPSFAAAHGDPKKGPYHTFMKVPAGFDSGWHTHNGDYSSIVVKGTITNTEQGKEAEAKALPVGSFWWQPGKINHKTTCGADSECIVAISNPKGFSYTAMTADGKKAPPQAAAAPAKADAKAEPARAEPAMKKEKMEKEEMKKEEMKKEAMKK